MKIGFIGLGIMGESMCENIVKKHDDKVYCFDFIKEKVDLLVSKGAISSRCWPDFFTEFGTPVCMVLSLLNAVNIPASCEADVYGASIVVQTNESAEKIVKETIKNGWEPHYVLIYKNIAEELEKTWKYA